METRRSRVVTGAFVLLFALLILLPVLGPGYVLTYDMVFVPRQPLTGDLLGLGWATPRAVPSDLVVALASHVVAGQVVQKLILLALVVGAGWGAARLCPCGGIAPAATALAYVWTPYLGSHLILGQWAVLVGYAALPWVLRAAVDVRTGDRSAVRRLLGALAIGALGGAPGWLITVPAALFGLLVARRPLGGSGARARLAVVLTGVVVFALPWALPALTRPARPGTDLLAAAGFAARSDTHLGVVGSVLTGSGMWNTNAEVAGHATVLYSIGAVVVLVIAGSGWWALRSWPGAGPLLAVGGLSVAVGLGSVVLAVRHVLAELPGGGLLRDATRYLPGWILLVAIGFGVALETLRLRMRTTDWAPAVTVLIILPAVILPAVGWGIGARLHAVGYPPDIARAVRVIDDDPRPGAVAVLPFTTYRAYTWNGQRPVLDVLPRWFSRPVVYATDLPITVHGHGVTIAGDDPFAARVGAQLSSEPPRTLGRLGVRWVVVDAARPAVDLTGLVQRFHGPDIAVYEVPDVDAQQARAPASSDRAPQATVIAGAVIWVGVFALLLGVWVVRAGYCLVTSARTTGPRTGADEAAIGRAD